MKPVYISSIRLAAPGLIGEEQAVAILAKQQAWHTTEFPALTPQLLPANERRRITSYIKLALQIADETNSTRDTTKPLAAVFASSNGDCFIIDHICNSTTLTPRHVSPTQFHNSVHNAPSGYWAIAAKSSMPSTSISTGNSTFASGLLEAVTQLLSSGEDILYVAYDYPPVEPSPLVKFIDVSRPFAVACILSQNKNTQTAGTISLSIKNAAKEKSFCVNRSLNELQNSNPIADSLPLFEALYLKKTTQLYLPFLNNTLLQVDTSQ